MRDYLTAIPDGEWDSKFKVKPSFKRVAAFLLWDRNSSEFKAALKEFKSNGYTIHCDFLNYDDAIRMVHNLKKIFAKYPITSHEADLAFLFLILYKSLFIETTRYRLPNKVNPANAYSIRDLLNFILQNDGKKLSITFTEIQDDEIKRQGKRVERKTLKDSIDDNPYLQNKYVQQAKSKDFSKVKPSHFFSNNNEINGWITSLIVREVRNGNVPLSLSNQLIKSEIQYNQVLDREDFLLGAPDEAFEHASKEAIYRDNILKLSAPILEYLNRQTKTFTKGNAKSHTFPQLSFLIELLILAGFYSPKNKKAFIFGETDPSTVDKRYLDTTFRNVLKNLKPS